MTGYSEEGDEVVLRMTREDYSALTFLLGVAAGASDQRQGITIMSLRLANRINEGNPRWMPYKIEEEE